MPWVEVYFYTFYFIFYAMEIPHLLPHKEKERRSIQNIIATISVGLEIL